MTVALKQHRSHRAARQGVSLVELLIVMSAATVILTISAALVHRIMLAHSKARAFVDVERTSLRLANAFRSDVHQSISATATDKPLAGTAFLQLELPAGQRLEYRREDGTISRVLFDGERTVSREAFSLTPGIELAITKDSPSLIALSISSPPAATAPEDRVSPSINYAVPVTLHVEAAVNRDQRFSGVRATP